ncbi:excinuclease ABC subunit UvrA [Candidatus Micrarchaeota archaeon]|nr:excinuclease ABC subunit UvrA [Candidatus Micrarchaeota archaeon]
MTDSIIVQGAREHNLKNINVTLPKNKLVVITGLSGSGKSSLAFDTIYAEGQRRYVESLSAYARQFLGLMEKPDVDSISGLSPAIAIEQKSVSKNPRSTVGTVTEIYDYLRLLYARIGTAHCPKCGKPIAGQSAQRITETLLQETAEVAILAPIVREKKGTYEYVFADLKKQGFSMARVDGKPLDLDDADQVKLEKYERHSIEAVVDRFAPGEMERVRLQDAVEAALKTGQGQLIASVNGKDKMFSQRNACEDCGTSLEQIEPRMFSFNSPFGACKECNGLGEKKEFDADLVIPDDSLSLLEGAVRPWRGMFKNYRLQAAEVLGKKLGFDLNTPLKKFTPKQKQALMYGSDETLQFRFHAMSSDSEWKHSGVFEGVMSQLQRQYQSAENDNRREDLELYMRSSNCPGCKGRRLKPESLAVKIQERDIVDIADMPVDQLRAFFASVKLDSRQAQIAKQVFKEINARLEFLHNVGLDYLTLSRSAATLSGGEGQRIRLATQIGSNLTGVLYVLDEPSIGLHQKDNDKLISTLKDLRDLGNTVLVVEHDEDTIRNADWVLDMGPGAGIHGGHVVAQGTPKAIEKHKDSLTGQYMRGEKAIPIPKKRRNGRKSITIRNATQHNLKGINVKIPLGGLVCVTGVSGSGKSTLCNDILYNALAQHFFNSKEKPGTHEKIEGLEHIDKVILVDQSPIGRTPRSNPATYIGVFGFIRDLYAATPEARARGYKAGRFSFNVPGGRCEKCEGHGTIKIEMQFLPDVYVTCEECGGKRFQKETLSVTYKNKTISDVLDMSVEEALELFNKNPNIKQRLQTIFDVGLGYIKLGQPATTLSGGEAQRIKLAAELSKRATGKTLYLLDEPTTGLHFDDVNKLLEVLHRLVDTGNTILIIEHNLDVIKSADWLIDLGPGGGDSGGYIIAEGTPEDVAKNTNSFTGQYLQRALDVKNKPKTEKESKK